MVVVEGTTKVKILVNFGEGARLKKEVSKSGEEFSVDQCCEGGDKEGYGVEGELEFVLGYCVLSHDEFGVVGNHAVAEE